MIKAVRFMASLFTAYGLAALCVIWAPPARADQQLWAAAYVDWTFANEAPGVGLTQALWIPQRATASFFTLNWDFVAGDGGYIGLQSNEAGAGNARFSLWNATAARGAGCRRFDGEGEGMTCEAPVAAAPDAVYRVFLRRGEADRQGQWWIGSLETPDGARQDIGALRVARASPPIPRAVAPRAIPVAAGANARAPLQTIARQRSTAPPPWRSRWAATARRTRQAPQRSPRRRGAGRERPEGEVFPVTAAVLDLEGRAPLALRGAARAACRAKKNTCSRTRCVVVRDWGSRSPPASRALGEIDRLRRHEFEEAFHAVLDAEA